VGDGRGRPGQQARGRPAAAPRQLARQSRGRRRRQRRPDPPPGAAPLGAAGVGGRRRGLHRRQGGPRARAARHHRGTCPARGGRRSRGLALRRPGHPADPPARSPAAPGGHRRERLLPPAGRGPGPDPRRGRQGRARPGPVPPVLRPRPGRSGSVDVRIADLGQGDRRGARGSAGQPDDDPPRLPPGEHAVVAGPPDRRGGLDAGLVGPARTRRRAHALEPGHRPRPAGRRPVPGLLPRGHRPDARQPALLGPRQPPGPPAIRRPRRSRRHRAG
jgi:hypothetical protein